MNNLISLWDYFHPQLFTLLVNTTWQIAILVTMIFLSVLVLRIKSSAICYKLWLIVVLSPLFLPLLNLVVPTFNINLFQNHQNEIIYEEALSRTDYSETTEFSDSKPIQNDVSTDTKRESDNISKSHFNWPFSLKETILLFWVLGASIMGVRFVKGFHGLHTLRKKAIPLEDDYIINLLNELRNSFGIKQKVQLATSDYLTYPVSFGWYKPIILMPSNFASRMSFDEIRMIFIHELAHFKHHDYLINIINSFLRIPLFFHPLFILAQKQLQIQQEHISDDWVLYFNKKRKAYAECLIRQAEVAVIKTIPSIGTSVISGLKNMKRRIDLILDRKRILSTNISKKSTAFILFICSICIAFAASTRLLSLEIQTKERPESTEILESPTSVQQEQPSDSTFKDEPIAHALYDRMNKKIMDAETICYESKYTWGREGKREYSTNYKIWLKKPNYARLEATSFRSFLRIFKVGRWNGILILDGEKIWMYWPNSRCPFLYGERAKGYNVKKNYYMVKPALEGRHSIGHEMGRISSTAMLILNPSIFHAQKDLSLSMKLDGVRMVKEDENYYVIEVSYMNHQRSKYFWISKNDYLPRMLKEVVKVHYNSIANEEWSNIKINEEISDDKFVWSPPEGWVEYKPPSIEEGLLKTGTEAPDFDLPLISGGRFKLSEYKGKVVWLCFWRVGCPSCRDEIPKLKEIHRRYKDMDLVVVGFNCSDDREIVNKFLQDNSITYPNIWDTTKVANDISWNKYQTLDGMVAVPLNYIIDRKGKIAGAWYDYNEEQEKQAIEILKKLNIE